MSVIETIVKHVAVKTWSCIHGHSIYVTHNIMDVAIIETGMKYYIATDSSILYTSCWAIRSDLNRSMWICLRKIMILWGSLPVQPGDCHIISAYTDQLGLSPVHQIIVAANKYDQLLSPGVENNCPHKLMQLDLKHMEGPNRYLSSAVQDIILEF